jgi:hypothetical protein
MGTTWALNGADLLLMASDLEKGEMKKKLSRQLYIVALIDIESLFFRSLESKAKDGGA